MRLRVAGVDAVGEPIEFVALLPLEGEGTGEERLEQAGVTLRTEGDKVIIDDVAFDSAGQTAGLDWDQEVLRVLRPQAQPSKYWLFIPALLALAGIVLLQGRRAENGRPVAAHEAAA